jgi:hypothetical protein
MKPQLSISLKKPCSEKWNTFKPAALGKWCAVCSKSVLDFTHWTHDQIVQQVQSSRSPICGRLLGSQLNYLRLPLQPGWKLFLMSLLVIISSFTSKPSMGAVNKLMAVTTTIRSEASALKGSVHDEDQQPLAGVNIYLKGTSIGTTTNEKGEFVFPEKLNAGDIIVFSFVGLETKEYVVPTNPPDLLEMTMQLDSTIMMGELVIEEVNTNTVKKPVVPRILNKVKSIF